MRVPPSVACSSEMQKERAGSAKGKSGLERIIILVILLVCMSIVEVILGILLVFMSIFEVRSVVGRGR